jgi:hypothetical protein
MGTPNLDNTPAIDVVSDAADGSDISVGGSGFDPNFGVAALYVTGSGALGFVSLGCPDANGDLTPGTVTMDGEMSLALAVDYNYPDRHDSFILRDYRVVSGTEATVTITP